MRIATLFLLPSCDLACRFCGSDTGFDSLTAEEARERVVSFATQGYGSLVLGGGEPLLWQEDVLALAAFARQLGLLTQLNTNGVAWRRELETSNALNRIILPLDGACAQTHDFLRAPQGGHFDLVQDRVQRLRQTRKEVTFGTVVCQHNRHDLAAICKQIQNWVDQGLKVHAWHLYRFLPMGRGGSRQGRQKELGLERSEFRQLCLPLQQSQRSWHIYRRPDMAHSQEVDFFWKQQGIWQASGRGAAVAMI